MSLLALPRPGEGLTILTGDGKPGMQPKGLLLRYDCDGSRIAFVCHTDMAAALPATTEGSKQLIISVSQTWLDNHLGGAGRSATLCEHIRTLPGGYYRQLLCTQSVLLLQEAMGTDSPGPAGHLMRMNRVLLLLEKMMARLEALLCEANDAAVLTADEERCLQYAEDVLRESVFGTTPTITQLARVAAMSPTRLKKIFKGVYGVPVYQYYQQARMHAARQLLVQEGLSIKEAGIKVGYSNLSHFAETFKKQFGLLPREVSGLYSCN